MNAGQKSFVAKGWAKLGGMTAVLLSALLASQGTIVRDSYGVPTIRANTIEDAFRLAGEAAAQDRLWQMEMSRRSARGTLAEVRGSRFIGSDTETRQSGYTDAELRQQVEAMGPNAAAAWRAFAQGVNTNIARRKASNALPEGYETYNFEPESWTIEDSAAIAVMMARRFGFGGAGELRNYAFLTYLRGQKAANQATDVLLDIAWWNDPRAVPTLRQADDPQAQTHLAFPEPTRQVTDAHIAELPKANLLELAGAIRLASADESTRVAQSLNVPYKTGSYAMVVHGSKTKNGKPIMLGAPQMGHSMPSIIFEQAIETPTLKVRGLSVPGIPGVLLGRTPEFSWTLTSGAADLADIFFFPKTSDTEYKFGAETRTITPITSTLKVKDGADVTVTQKRTHWGPVILDSRAGNAFYVQRSSIWMRELVGFGKLLELQTAKDGGAIRKALNGIPLSFNFFYATAKGEIGWRFCGNIPLRAPGTDPRFPTPGLPKNDWRGMIPAAKMPFSVNPRSGQFTNWNNKPVDWWPNYDTPIWGELFRIESLNDALQQSVREVGTTPEALVRTSEAISRSDQASHNRFLPSLMTALRAQPPTDPLQIEAIRELEKASPFRRAGQIGPRIYDETVGMMQEILFTPLVGNALGNLRIVAQPTLMMNALAGKTRVDYLAGRDPQELWRQAFFAACAKLTKQAGPSVSDWGFVSDQIRYGDLPGIPFLSRGTYIFTMDWSEPNAFKAVAGPGQAESGPHSTDQAALVRSWTFRSPESFSAPRTSR